MVVDLIASESPGDIYSFDLVSNDPRGRHEGQDARGAWAPPCVDALHQGVGRGVGWRGLQDSTTTAFSKDKELEEVLKVNGKVRALRR
jgi:hypothetical protein